MDLCSGGDEHEEVPGGQRPAISNSEGLLSRAARRYSDRRRRLRPDDRLGLSGLGDQPAGVVAQVGLDDDHRAPGA